ncbi:hypothetical protein [Paraclostridium bifermentans]|uniref:hypothetical protein n=1 Tax=Paraclostridium bifermentans TaxID=1490 RepID=UPI00290A31C5|nr:hypothetical protein [Paraclostridium bifermentans]MDU3338208.1 hypothetical protein [Paraclostridium bifermentans]
MFDNIEIRKAYKVRDNIMGNDIEVCTFNAYIDKNSGLVQNMNIIYPLLYKQNKTEIQEVYKSFIAEAGTLAITMELADKINDDDLMEFNDESIKANLNTICKEVIDEIIASLNNITINEVPSIR